MSRAPHQYRDLPPEEQEALLSNFLISSWSYSKVSTFVRHQKVFEMENIYGIRSKRSSGSIAGNGYHTALDYFFSQFKEGVLIELPMLEAAAYEEIGSVPANQWKLQKTTPTMEEAVNDALKDVTKLLLNFFKEKGIYLDDLEEIEGVEFYFSEFLTINGVDIPLPCHGKIDLIIRLKNGKRIIIDHKSKDAYTNEKEAALVTGMQAITYTKGYEARTGMRVDEVWFIENKPSKNTNGNSQLQDIRIVMDDNSRSLFELLLYENLREMISAVKDPDHVYTINPADKYVDMAEVFDFWTRTQICEVEDFNVDESKKELVSKRLRKIRNSSGEMINPEIIKKFREKAATFIKYDLSVLNMTQTEKIEFILTKFNAPAQVAHKFEGYSSDTYLLEVSAGVKIGSIYKYRLDIANALNVENVRMSKDLVVHEKRSYLSIECAKERKGVLYFNPDDLQGFKIPLGKDNYGNTIFWDLDNQATPHMLVCGATGSGKSVHIINILEYAQQAEIDEIVILDPKREFGKYSSGKVIVVHDIPDIERVMEKLVKKMEERIERGISKKTLVIFDEFADAVDNARKGKELYVYEPVEVGVYASGMPKIQDRHVRTEKSLEENLKILLQKGRSSGYRILAAAQRASVNVIRGDAKVNFPVRVCFYVPKAADSMVVLDEAGAEALTGKGDGLISSPEYRDTIRFQAYYKPQNQPA